MDWNVILLIALVVLMLVCCFSMIRMGKRPKRTRDVDDQR
jgi:multisubunit Na+/H+ antiporter MnhF subunit